MCEQDFTFIYSFFILSCFISWHMRCLFPQSLEWNFCSLWDCADLARFCSCEPLEDSIWFLFASSSSTWYGSCPFPLRGLGIVNVYFLFKDLICSCSFLLRGLSMFNVSFLFEDLIRSVFSSSPRTSYGPCSLLLQGLHIVHVRFLFEEHILSPFTNWVIREIV